MSFGNGWFKVLRVAGNETITPKGLLLLLAVSLVSIYIGINFGGIISGFSETETKGASQPLSSVKETPHSAANYWEGTVRKITGLDVDMEGDFKLVDEKGETVAVLQSSKIDLGFLEGIMTTLEGKKIKLLKNGVPLVIVEKAKFK